MDYQKAVRNIFGVVAQLGVLMVGMVFLLGGILYFIDKNYPPEAQVMDMPAVFKVIVLFVSLLGIGSIPVIKKIFLEHNPVAQMDYVPRSVFVQLQWTLISVSMLSLLFCEAPVIYGFFLFFLTRNLNDYWVLAAISTVGFMMHFPRIGDWERWLFSQSNWKKMAMEEMKAKQLEAQRKSRPGA